MLKPKEKGKSLVLSPPCGMATNNSSKLLRVVRLVLSPLGGMATIHPVLIVCAKPCSKPTGWDGDLNLLFI